ncbi:MAG: fused MFS/spermidine synthase [Methylobacteriaceae bacterium]|nr:fused MFS/spermidine synthase [Methylobacteriaceae bacterium]
MALLRRCFISALLVLLAFVSGGAWAQGERTLVESRESLYNNIYIYKQGSLFFLTFGLNKALYVESAFNAADELELPAPYTRFMTVGLAYAHSLGSILEIGSGGGRTSSYLHRSLPSVPITSVELDPVVIELSHKYFGTKEEPNFSIVNEDGRQFLARSPQKFDVILLDAYHGPFVPFHLLTREFYDIVRQHLADGGVVMQNLDPGNQLFDSVIKTIGSVFPHTDLYLAEGNVVFAAYDGPPRSTEELAKLAAERQGALKLRYNVGEMARQRRPLLAADPTIDPKATILTDDFAPVEALKTIERHNREWPSPATGR